MNSNRLPHGPRPTMSAAHQAATRRGATPREERDPDRRAGSGVGDADEPSPPAAGADPAVDEAAGDGAGERGLRRAAIEHREHPPAVRQQDRVPDVGRERRSRRRSRPIANRSEDSWVIADLRRVGWVARFPARRRAPPGGRPPPAAGAPGGRGHDLRGRARSCRTSSIAARRPSPHFGQHDRELVAAHVAAHGSGREDDPVARAVRLAGGIDGLRRARRAAPARGPRGTRTSVRGLPDQVPQPDQHEQREQRPDDAEQEKKRQPPDQRSFQSGMTNMAMTSRIWFQSPSSWSIMVTAASRPVQRSGSARCDAVRRARCAPRCSGLPRLPSRRGRVATGRGRHGRVAGAPPGRPRRPGRLRPRCADCRSVAGSG